MKKRIVSLILVTLLVAGLLATAVFAGADPVPVNYGTCTHIKGGTACGKTVTTHVDYKAPTCTNDGNIEYYICECGACYNPSETEPGKIGKYINTESELKIAKVADAHTFVYRAEVPATCTTAGTKAYFCCTECHMCYFEDATDPAKPGKYFGSMSDASIPALGHDAELTHHEAKDATCTEDGNIEYYSCSKCNKNFADAEATTEIATSVTVTKLGHDWKEKTWTWTPAKNGGWNVTLVLKCERVGCTTTCEPKVTVTSAVTTKPTATKDGVRTWTATATQDGKTYTSTKETTEPKTGVDYYYGAVLYFNSNGGSTVTPIYTNTTKTVDLTKYIPTRRGYTFAGWYADARLTTPISSITLYPTGYRYNNYNSYTVYAGWYDDTWCSACSFWDVDYYDWYHDEIRYVVDNGIMEGISSNWFAPEEAMTRADLVVAMYRIAGSPSTRYTGVFTDVKSTADYAIAVEWAAKYGIVNGVGNKKFDPNSAVTREQMAAIFYRFGKYVDKYGFTPYRTTGFFWNFSKLAFADTKKISNYAKDPVAWCVKNGIFYGDNSNRFNPQDNTTRGECAAILYRFCK